jgi:hypothetical protein
MNTFDLEFLKFFSWNALWAWVLSDTVSRYAVPYFDKFYDVLDEMVKTREDNGKVNHYFIKAIAVLIEIIFSICLTYMMVSWSVWCIVRCVLYTQGLDVNRSVYFITGGICCIFALGVVARASVHKHFLGVLPYIVSMGSFVVFSMNYEPIRTTFPWIIKFVGLNSL